QGSRAILCIKLACKRTAGGRYERLTDRLTSGFVVVTGRCRPLAAHLVTRLCDTAGRRAAAWTGRSQARGLGERSADWVGARLAEAAPQRGSVADRVLADRVLAVRVRRACDLDGLPARCHLGCRQRDHAARGRSRAWKRLPRGHDQVCGILIRSNRPHLLRAYSLGLARCKAVIAPATGMEATRNRATGGTGAPGHGMTRFRVTSAALYSS